MALKCVRSAHGRHAVAGALREAGALLFFCLNADFADLGDYRISRR